MTFSKTDLPHLKWSLLIFLFSLAISVTVVVLSENFVSRAQADYQTAQRQLGEARARLAAAEDDRANMSTYAREYATLLDRKIIGGDKRLDWIEGLEEIQQQNQAPQFTYTIAPQQPYTPVPPLDSGNFSLSLSGMTLQLELLHEEQLIAFFEALRTKINGRFFLDNCKMERSGSISSSTVSSDSQPVTLPQLKAECSGGWLTIKNRNEQ